MSPLPHLPPSFLAALPPPALGLDFDPRPSPLLARLQALVLPTPRSYVRADGAVAPDHWLDPSDVWEVKCADLSLSPIYPAARGLVSNGGTLRRSSERIPAEWLESSGEGILGPMSVLPG